MIGRRVALLSGPTVHSLYCDITILMLSVGFGKQKSGIIKALFVCAKQITEVV